VELELQSDTADSVQLELAPIPSWVTRQLLQAVGTDASGDRPPSVQSLLQSVMQGEPDAQPQVAKMKPANCSKPAMLFSMHVAWHALASLGASLGASAGGAESFFAASISVEESFFVPVSGAPESEPLGALELEQAMSEKVNAVKASETVFIVILPWRPLPQKPCFPMFRRLSMRRSTESNAPR
jgi:hypothetical protein